MPVKHFCKECMDTQLRTEAQFNVFMKLQLGQFLFNDIYLKFTFSVNQEELFDRAEYLFKKTFGFGKKYICILHCGSADQSQATENKTRLSSFWNALAVEFLLSRHIQGLITCQHMPAMLVFIRGQEDMSHLLKA